MDHSGQQEIIHANRIGFHYFPDTLHFTEPEIQRWIPILKRFQVNWLAVLSSTRRAIPEVFIQACCSEKINLFIDFALTPAESNIFPEIEPLIRAYGKWGGKYILLDHAPNMRVSWGTSGWGDPNLIAGYCERFMKFAEIALENGIHPVFPPLQPGGDYWDLAFLKNCMVYLAGNASGSIINNLTFCAYGWDFGKSLDWGAGGPSSWPRAKAYHLDGQSENQLGFRAYEWHSATIESVFSRKFPFHLLQIGHPGILNNSVSVHWMPDFSKQDTVIRLLNRENVYDPQKPDYLLNHIHEEVLSGFFHLLASDNPTDLDSQWFSAQGEALAPAQAYAVRHKAVSQPSGEKSASPPSQKLEFQYKRYILLSEDLRTEAPDILAEMQPYLDRYNPIVGYSIHKAAQSAMIIYITRDWQTDEEVLRKLRYGGNLVKQVHRDEIPNLLVEINRA